MKKWALAILFCLLFVTLVIRVNPASATIEVIDDDFESGSLTGWTASSGVGIVNGVTGANGKVVRVKDTGSGESNLIKSVPALGGYVTAEMRVMTDATDKEKRIHFSKNDSGGQKAFVYLKFTTTGKLTAQLSSGEVEILSSVTPNQWYSLKVDMNVATGRYDVYVDGVLLASQVARNLSTATQIDYVNFKSRSGGALFVDEVKLYQTASVVAIDDKFEGSTLSGWTATSGVGLVSGVTGADGKVVRVKDSGSGESNLTRSVPALTGNVIAEMRVMTDALDKEKRIHFSKNDSGGQKAFVYLNFTAAGKLMAQLSSGEVEILSSVTAGQWYSLKVDMNVTTGKYDVYVDGVLKASQVARNLSTANQIDYVNFKSRSGGALFVDNVKLYQVALPPELTTVPTFESASYYIPYANSSAQVVVSYREVGETEWKQAYEPFYSASEKEFRGSIVYLQEDTAYEVKADITESGIIAYSLTSTFTTWSPDVPIDETIPVSELYSGGQLLIDGLEGSETGWIKIVGDGTTIDVGNGAESSLVIKNSKYLILENLVVQGGKVNGISVTLSESIRLFNNEVSGWGRVGTFDPVKGYSVDENGAIIDFDAGIKVWDASKIVVERNYVHDPRGHSNSWYGPTWSNVHPHGPEAMNVKSGTGTGGIVIRYNDFIGSDDHRWNDAIGEVANGFTYSGLSRDGDVYGNMLAFGNDDGIELDGGQKNLRFYNNKIEGFYSGISAAPDMQGPSYIFRNLIVNLGDSFNRVSSFIKAGGGDTYSKGREYVFHNTIFSRGQGINGIGYGSDANRDMFNATTRNNIIVNTRYSKDTAIKDNDMTVSNDFDYDVIGNTAISTGAGRVLYSAGQEANGMFGLPLFANVANGDFRLQSSSLGKDGGQPLANFASGFTGTAPDAGAMEQGAATLMPVRPIPLTADNYQVNLKGNTQQTVTVTVGTLDGGSTPYRIRKNDANDWLEVSPTSGVLTSNSTLTFTVQADTTKFRRELEKTVVLLRLDNGYSLPVSVYADNTPPVTDLEITQKRINAASDPIGIYNMNVNVGLFANNEELSYITYQYSLDGGANWNSYNGPIAFTADGLHTLTYRATDASGNIESARTFQFVIDHTASESAPASIIVDNTDPGFSTSGTWAASTSTGGFLGTNYSHDGTSTADSPSLSATWTPTVPEAGNYNIYMRWPAATNRPDAAPIEIKYNGGIDGAKTVNQTVYGNQWVLLGNYNLSQGTDNYVKILASDVGYTIADAVRFVSDAVQGPVIRSVKVDGAVAAITGVNAQTSTSAQVTGSGSWASIPNAKMELYIDPAMVMGVSPFKVKDIESIAYRTKKSGPDPLLDFSLEIYTEPTGVGDDASWYGKRLTTEPRFANQLSAPVNQWNTWTTNAGTNQLVFYDSNRTSMGFNPGPTLNMIQAGTIDWTDYSGTGTRDSVDYSNQDVLAIKFGTGSAWTNFNGNIDYIQINLTNGSKVIFDLEP